MSRGEFKLFPSAWHGQATEICMWHHLAYLRITPDKMTLPLFWEMQFVWSASHLVHLQLEILKFSSVIHRVLALPGFVSKLEPNALGGVLVICFQRFVLFSCMTSLHFLSVTLSSFMALLPAPSTLSMNMCTMKR